jgi:RNA polymerase sigma factor (sigma-70 family)
VERLSSFGFQSYALSKRRTTLKDAATTLVERKTLRKSVRCRGAGCAPNTAGHRASLRERPRCRFPECLNRLPFAMHPCDMAVMTSSAVEEASALIASVAAGDEIAFASIVRLHHEDMRRVCIVVAGDDGIAEDAVAAAWSIAWRKLGSLRDPARLRPWLVSVAVNEARQLLRARKRRSLVEVPVVQVDEPRGGLDPGATINAIDLRNALARLDANDRALIAMRYMAGFDATELAFATGRSPSGTRARLARLLQRLERELGDE